MIKFKVHKLDLSTKIQKFLFGAKKHDFYKERRQADAKTYFLAPN